MNERIEKLSMEANAQTGNEFDLNHKPLDAFLAKFAELIVRECADIAAQTACPYEDEFAKQTYGHTWDMACVESAKDIRKHFGVE